MKRLWILILAFIILPLMSLYSESKADEQIIERIEVHVHYSGAWVLQYGHIGSNEPLVTFNGQGNTYYDIDVDEYSADVGIVVYKADSSQELLVILLQIIRSDIIETYTAMTYDKMVGLSYIVNLIKKQNYNL